jgi:hypothetical protein
MEAPHAGDGHCSYGNGLSPRFSCSKAGATSWISEGSEAAISKASDDWQLKYKQEPGQLTIIGVMSGADRKQVYLDMIRCLCASVTA